MSIHIANSIDWNADINRNMNANIVTGFADVCSINQWFTIFTAKGIDRKNSTKEIL
jgi:hypothetical protein